MADTSLRMTWANPQQAHVSLSSQLWPWAKSMLAAGHTLAVSIAPKEDDRSIQQNRFYWGACLKDISEQAKINGQRYTADAWHELFKRQFLPRVVKKSAVAGRKRKVVTVSIGSTTGLSVRKMSLYLEKVQAFAASELGVQFTIQSWDQWR
jgi:hypothetical protein